MNESDRTALRNILNGAHISPLVIDALVKTLSANGFRRTNVEGLNISRDRINDLYDYCEENIRCGWGDIAVMKMKPRELRDILEDLH